MYLLIVHLFIYSKSDTWFKVFLILKLSKQENIIQNRYFATLVNVIKKSDKHVHCSLIIYFLKNKFVYPFYILYSDEKLILLSHICPKKIAEKVFGSRSDWPFDN